MDFGGGRSQEGGTRLGSVGALSRTAPCLCCTRGRSGLTLTSLSWLQRISYTKSVSHATISYNEGPEAVYAIKAGLRTAAEKAATRTSKLTVSGAQKKQMEEGKKAKRGREDEEEDESDSEEEGPEKKKGKEAQGDVDSGALWVARRCGSEADAVSGDADAMEEDSDEEEPAAQAIAASGTEANPTLFVEGLPEEVTSDMLSPLFQQCVPPSFALAFSSLTLRSQVPRPFLP